MGNYFLEYFSDSEAAMAECKVGTLHWNQDTTSHSDSSNIVLQGTDANMLTC